MAKSIVLMGSPRPESNTDILANRIIDGLKAGGQRDDDIEKINLVEYQQFVCCACGECRTAGVCLKFSKVTDVLEKIKAADNLVLATPTWWLGPSSSLKIFMDHWGAFLRLDYTSRIAGKKVAIAACCANPAVNFAEKVCEGFSGILSILGVDVVGTLGVMGVKDIGAVSQQVDALEGAFALGQKLAQA